MRAARLEHPAVVRLCHWLSALAAAILVASGLELFAAFPSFGDKVPQRDLFTPPEIIRLGGWLGGALQWHLTFAWLFLITGIVYGSYQAATRNFRQVLFVSADAGGVWPMVRHYFLSGPRPAQHDAYNPLQKLAYTTAIALGLVLAVTGLALYKPVQLSSVVWLLGGLRLTRTWHFAAMSGLVAFVPGHIIMVALHGWRNFASMWTGSQRSAP
ncbi:MAG TPA: cytochrome b/b6 domain-containing protein [Vicinamibacterales bacterium]|nr:cytochrome b/b6 domain-containing protein [Vicinamibacterales bacterium]